MCEDCYLLPSLIWSGFIVAYCGEDGWWVRRSFIYQLFVYDFCLDFYSVIGFSHLLYVISSKVWGIWFGYNFSDKLEIIEFASLHHNKLIAQHLAKLLQINLAYLVSFPPLKVFISGSLSVTMARSLFFTLRIGPIEFLWGDLLCLRTTEARECVCFKLFYVERWISKLSDTPWIKPLLLLSVDLSCGLALRATDILNCLTLSYEEDTPYCRRYSMICDAANQSNRLGIVFEFGRNRDQYII